MAVKIENMIKKTLKDSAAFNPYPYHDKAVCNQFVFAIDGPSYLDTNKTLICRIVPKDLWDKKKRFYTEEINLSMFLGPNSQDVNGTGSWLLPDFSSDPMECAKQLVALGFIWDKSLQKSVLEQPSDDVTEWISDNFDVSPSADISLEIHKEITPEIELEIFESRLGVKQQGIQKAMLNFHLLIRSVPITKESVLLEFLKKYNIPYDADIDGVFPESRLPTSACWLDKSLILEHYIQVVPKDMKDKYGRSLMQIAKQYKAIKSEKILINNGFV